MRYRLSVKGTEVGADLLTVLVTEGERSRLCAFATARAKEFHASLPKTVGDEGPTARSLPDIIPAAVAPGYRQVEEGPGTPREAEAVASWHRSWQEGEYGGATVSAIRYSSVSAAEAAARRLLEGLASDAVEQFDVGGIAGAVGVRYLGYAWLWIQPPTEGRVIDTVVIPFSDVVVLASVSNLAATDGHEVVNDLAGEIQRLAAR